MNCWKTINFTKQYGSQRLFILSSLTMLLTFVFAYVPATYIFVPSSYQDNHLILFGVGIWMIYPLHKFLHFIPISGHKQKIKKSISMKYRILPIINIRITDPISKWLFLLSLTTPIIVMNGLLILLCFLYPNYVHYFVVLLAYHTGISLSDLICVKNVISAPNRSYIEESEDGIEILLHSHGR